MPLSAEIALKTIDGEARTLDDFAGQALLIVNVASECGFTPQYAGLEALHRRFRARGFAVLGFPCDQFGHQEPGDEAAIQNFCTDKYDVTFPMFAKIEVNGANAHPLFKALKQEAPGLLGTRAIKWNFTKFLVDRQLRVVRRYAPNDSRRSSRATSRQRSAQIRREARNSTRPHLAPTLRASHLRRDELGRREVDGDQSSGVSAASPSERPSPINRQFDVSLTKLFHMC